MGMRLGESGIKFLLILTTAFYLTHFFVGQRVHHLFKRRITLNPVFTLNISR